MRTLAFDQATNITAWALFDGDDLISFDLIDLKKVKDIMERVQRMDSEIGVLIDALSPDVVVFEDVNFQTNAQSLIDLARLQGRIMHICETHHLPYRFYKPTAWRKQVEIKQGRMKRSELKAQACALVKERYHLSDIEEDIAEAICIGLCDIQKTLKE